MPPIIEVNSLSKVYQLGAIGATTLRDSVMRAWQSLCGNKISSSPETFWALKDVSFTVNRGEIIGLIGRNGAGKSTLLKILSRITEPTSGQAILRGRIASLLEVGTGFHPELTGRENIYLNGAILGMRKSEIDGKFDEIVHFAEIEKFIDTPVKHYSSGMYVRLAFAVAAHLEPEILLVDEVLAVGDTSFQKKCLGKMNEIASEGRTILFVSHSLSAILRLTKKTILLDKGQIKKIDLSEKVIEYYLESTSKAYSAVIDLRNVPRSGGDQKVSLSKLTLKNERGEISNVFSLFEAITIELEFASTLNSAELEAGFAISTLDGFILFASSSADRGQLLEIKPLTYAIRATLYPNYLKPGRYLISIGLTCAGLRDLVSEIAQIEIFDSELKINNPIIGLPGHFYFPCRWGQVEELT